MQTITHYTQHFGKLYVKTTANNNQKLVDQAMAEGFCFADGVPANKRTFDCVMAFNADKTINFVGFAGHFAFDNAQACTTKGHTNGNVTTFVVGNSFVRFDYDAYLQGKNPIF